MCMSLAFVQQLIVWLIVAAAIVAIIKLVVPWLDSVTGLPIIGQVLMIVLWAIVAIMVVYFIFGLLTCLAGGGPPFHPLR